MKASPDIKPKIVDESDSSIEEKPKIIDEDGLSSNKQVDLVSKRITWIYKKLINSGKVPDFEEKEFKSYLDYKKDKTRYFVNTFYNFFQEALTEITQKMINLFIYFSLLAVFIFQSKSFVDENGSIDLKNVVLEPDVLMNYLLSGDYITPYFINFYVLFGIVFVVPSLSLKICNLFESLFLIPKLYKKKNFNDVNELYMVLERGADLDDLPGYVLDNTKI